MITNDSLIHPSAVISETAQIGSNVRIGAFCVVGDHVRLDDGVELKSHVVVDGYTSVGSGTIIHPFASIGGAPQDLKFAGEKTYLKIGKNNVIREHVTMNPGTVTGETETVIGDNCLFMMGAHVAHDCRVGNNVILANNATIAGHVRVDDHVIIGGLSAVHQFIHIGAHAIIGGMSGVEANVIPYARVKGERASLAGLNLIGLGRRGFDKAEVKGMQKAFSVLFGAEGTLDQRITQAQQAFAGHEGVEAMIAFIKAQEGSKFPLCQPAKRR